jgi:bifunctional non-homologous end joining protein LigD
MEPCIPTIAQSPPTGPQWIQEIKRDGHQLIVCKRGARVRLFTRRGYDWTEHYPPIRAAAEALTIDATIDGEAVVCAGTGVADFELLHSRENDRRAILCAFDLLVLAGHNQRTLALESRKARLLELLRGVPAGIQYNDHLAGDGTEIFAHACRLGCEGVVSKDRTCPYQLGPSKTSRIRLSLDSRSEMRRSNPQKPTLSR